MKSLMLFAILALSCLAQADTPPVVNLFRMKAPSCAGTITIAGSTISCAAGGSSGDVLTWNGSAWVSQAPASGGATSVGLALPSSIFTVTGSPVTSAGALTGTFTTQAANQSFMGPVGGSPGVPSFRSLVAADLPLSASAPIQYSGGVISCITATGSVAGCLSAADWTTFNGKQASISNGTCAPHQFATSQTSGAIGCSSILAADVPTLNQSTSGNAGTATALAANPTDCSANNYATAIDASGNLTCGAVSDSGLAASYVKADGSRALSATWSAGQEIKASKLTVLNGTETVALTNDSSTICLDNTSHSAACFLRFRINTAYTSMGTGTNTNSWSLAVNNAATDTAPVTGMTPNGAGSAAPGWALHNSSSTNGNYSYLISTTAGLDRLTSGWIFFNDNHGTGTEEGHIEAITSVAGTKGMKMRIAAKGQVSYSGTAPTVGTCGTGPTVVGTDNASRVTIGTGGSATACTLTFNGTWSNAPICSARNEVTGESMIGKPSTTALTFSRPGGGAFGASDTIAINCAGYY